MRKYIIISLSLCLTLLVNACNDNKTTQCQRLVDVVNKGINLIDKNKGQQVTTSLKLSQDLENVTQDIQQLKLKDPKLQEFQSRFGKVFETLSQSIAKASQALNSAKTVQTSSDSKIKIQKARGEIDTALTVAANTANQFDKIASQMNKYCSQSK